MSLVRYAVIGCGEHARRGHILPSLNVPGLELHGLYDPSPASIEKTMEDLRAEGYAGTPRVYSHVHGIEELVRDDEVQLVVIASPDRWHFTNLQEVIGHGKHAFVEKPLAVDFQELNGLPRLLVEAGDRGVLLTSCHPRRFDPPYLWVQKNLAKFIARYGAVTGVSLDFSYHAPTKVGLHTGLLMDHINHEFDFVNWILGHVSTTFHRLHDSEVSYAVAGQREDGVTLFFNGTRRLEVFKYPEIIRLRFERGEITVHCDTGFVDGIEHGVKTFKDAAGGTNYELRFRSMMESVRDSVRAIGSGEVSGSYLAPQDLIANTAAGIHLTKGPEWHYVPNP